MSADSLPERVAALAEERAVDYALFQHIFPLGASGGVKIVEIGRLKIDVSEAGFLLSAGAPHLVYRRKMAEEAISGSQ